MKKINKFTNELNETIKNTYLENPKVQVIVKLYPIQVYKIMQSFEITCAGYSSFCRLIAGEVDYVLYETAKIYLRDADEKIILI